MDSERKDSEPEIMDLYIPPDNNSILHPLSIGPQSSMLSNIINDDPHTSMIRPYTGTIRKDYLDHKLPIIQEPMHAKDPTNVLHSLLNEVHHEISYPTTTSIKPQIYTVQNRFFDKQPLFNNAYKSPTITPKSPSYSRPPVKKESVFTKVATFELPKKNEHVLKHDVTPRKDFTKAKSLAKDYMDSRRHLIIAKKEKPKTAVGFLKSLTEHVTTKVPHLNSAEEKVISFNYYLKKADSKNVKPNKNNILSDNELEDSSKEKPNDKLMTLLDKLEQEVKHIELDKNKKEVLDAKIRKIYGTLVGKTELSTYKPNIVELPDSELVSDHEKYEPNRIKYSDMDNHLLAKKTRKHIFNGHKSDKKHIHEKMVENVHPDDSQNEVRPVSTNLNDLIDRYNEIKSNKNRDLKIGKDYDSDNENRKSKYSRIVFSNRDEPSDVDPYSDKEAIRNRIIFSEAEEKKRIKELSKKNRQPLSDHEEDPLSLERRKYYQEKLDKMKRKLYSTRKYKHHSEAQLPSSNPIMRPIIQSPSRNEEPTHEHTKSQADPFYMPDRARFLHGF